MDYSFLNCQVVKDYNTACDELTYAAPCEYAEASKRYIKALDAYVSLLDKHDIRMPPSLFKFNPEDTRTWRYIDCKISGKNFVRYVENPNFKYMEKCNGL